jgi:WD40 repeat protein
MLQVWDADTGVGLVQAEQEGIVHCLAYSPDRTLLAGGLDDAAILLWDTAGNIRFTLRDEDQIAPVTALAFAPGGARLASASATGLEVWLWDVAQGEPCLLIPDAIGGCAIECLAIHPQGAVLAVGGVDWLATGGSDGAIALWNTAERCEIATLDGGSKAIAFDPSGSRLASATLARSICVWEIEGPSPVLELIGHEDLVTCLAYSPDGRFIASGSDDRGVFLWDANSGKLLAAVHLNTQVKAIAFSPDGQSLYTGNGNTTCYQVGVAQMLAGLGAS